MQRFFMRTFFALVFIVGFGVPSAFAADLYVGTQAGDYATIGDAIAAAASGDNVIVRAGTYSEDVTIDKPRLVLRTSEGAVLDGNVSIEAELVRFAGFAMPLGKNITVADGISYTGAALTSVIGVDISSAEHEEYNVIVGDITVEGGSSARGISLSTTSDGRLHTGLIDVTGNDADSTVEGVYVMATSGMTATVGDIDVEGGAKATGLFWRTSGDGGSLIKWGGLDVTAREATSQAYGADVVAENDFILTVGSTTVSGGNLARGLSYYVGQGGSLFMEGDVAVTTGGNAHGLLLNAGRDFEADVKSVTVTGGGNVVQGVAVTMGDRGTIRHEGVITVRGTELVSNVRGVNINAADDMNLSFGDIDVEGLKNAIGIYANAGNGGMLALTGAIQAKTTAVASSASGTAITAADDFTMTIGDIVTTADATGSHATGAYVLAGDGFTSRGGDVTVTGHTSAAGVDLRVSADADFALGDIRVASIGAGSSAVGMNLLGAQNTEVTLSDIDVEGLADAVGLSLRHRDSMLGHVLDNARITQTGTVNVVASQLDSAAYGVLGEAGDDLTAIFGEITATAKKSATGVALSMGERATVDVGSVQAVAEDAASTAYGTQITGKDGLDVTLGDVTSRAGQTAYGIWYRTDALGTLTQTGAIEVQATDSGTNSYAYGAWITDEGDVSATLDDVTASADQFAKGVTFYTDGSSSLKLSGDLNVTGRNTESTAYGVDFSGGRALALELQNVKIDAGKNAYGINLGGATSTMTVRGDVSATATGGDMAMGILVNSLVASVTNHGHVYAEANYALGVGFGQYTALERVRFHNVGTVETSGTSGAAALVRVSEQATVQNDGTIDANGKIAFEGRGSSGSINLTNSGDILGHVYLGQGTDDLYLSGTGRIVGNVDMGADDDRFILEGNATVDGRVLLGAGDDEATIHYGATLAGLLDGGLGDDTLTLLGDAAGELPHGFMWSRFAAARFEQTSIAGGAWRIGVGTDLGAVDVHEAFLRIDDEVSIADLHMHEGVLVGQGDVTGDVANDGGVVSPGNSFGILTITGNYTQGPDGVLYIELDATTAPEAGVNYDQLVIVGGTGIFEDGTTVRIRPTFGAARPDRAEYTIVAGVVDFDLDAINLDIVMPEHLFYGGWLENGSMKLILAVVPYDSIGETLNQRAVGQALTRAKSKPDTDLDDLYDWLDNLPSGEADAARAAFDSLSGEVYAHAAGLNSRIADRFASAVLRSVGVDSTQEPRAPERNVWAARYTDTGRANEADGAAATLNLSGLVAGVDLVQRPDLRIGVSMGGGTASVGVNEQSSTLQGNGYLLGAYGQFDFDDVGLTAVLGFGQETYNARRAVQFGGDQRTSTAAFSTNNIFVTAEARSASVAVGDLRVEPVAALAWLGSRRAGFREQGAGALGLIVDEYSTSHWYGRFGLEPVFEALQWGSAVVRPHARFAFTTDFGSAPATATARLQGAATTPFTVTGAKARASGIELALGLTGTSSGGWTWGLDYEGHFRGGTKGHGFLGRMSYGF